jgi:hypothetical protein
VRREKDDQGDAEKYRQRDNTDFVGAKATQALQNTDITGAIDFQGLLI